MKRDTHERALRATAQLALPLTLLGCASATSEPPRPAPNASATNAPAPAAPPTAPAAGCTTQDPGNPAPGEVACCHEVIAADLRAHDGAVATDEGRRCCQTIAVASDRARPRAQWLGTERTPCCSALDWRGSRACTPWGPPVPPSDSPHAEPARVATPLDLREAAAAHAPDLPPCPALYAAARGTWLGRMVNEYESAEVFRALGAQLRAAGLDEAWSAQCAAFAREERAHGVLCGAVVTALGGEAVAAGTARPRFPRHAGVAPLEAAARNVLSVCCLSETVAVALIGAERLEMPAGALRDLLTRIWADEVGHARYGWRLLASLATDLGPDGRARLGAWLALAFAHLEAHELAHLPLGEPPDGGAALGLCRGAAARALFYDVVARVIVPSLEALGLPARDAWASRGPRARAVA